ncbi:MAG: hypothetical protein OER86_09040 [Phycisphaerae bacterium]|nr:hypothetical protein [Phycisphaerae bacterium]
MFAIDLLKKPGRHFAAVVLGTVVLAATACNEHDHSKHDHSAPKKDVTPGAAAGVVPTASYPLDTCVVSGEKLGDHGKPYDHKHEGRLVRFCCEACIDDFNKDPAKYLAKIDQALAAKAAAGKK